MQQWRQVADHRAQLLSHMAAYIPNRSNAGPNFPLMLCNLLGVGRLVGAAVGSAASELQSALSGAQRALPSPATAKQEEEAEAAAVASSSQAGPGAQSVPAAVASADASGAASDGAAAAQLHQPVGPSAALARLRAAEAQYDSMLPIATHYGAVMAGLLYYGCGWGLSTNNDQMMAPDLQAKYKA